MPVIEVKIAYLILEVCFPANTKALSCEFVPTGWDGLPAWSQRTGSKNVCGCPSEEAKSGLVFLCIPMYVGLGVIGYAQDGLSKLDRTY
jgi:hypothetical protein